MKQPLDIRIYRSPDADYSQDEPLVAPSVYTDDELAAIAAAGFNGIWLHAILRYLAPTDLFRPYVEDVDERVEALALTCRRAARHGIGVWLYLNEPLSFDADHRFWSDHPECRGIRHQWGLPGWPERVAMCTSAEPVKGFLENASAELFRRVEGLAGLLVVTAAEHQTSCYSHVATHGPGWWGEPRLEQTCPRCRARRPADVITEIVRLLHQGMRASAPSAKLVAWSWRWIIHYADPQEEIISDLPDDVLLMTNYEEGVPLERAGRAVRCEEYSLSVVGPGPLFEAHARLARRRETGLLAKLQVSASHELGTTPNIPDIVSLYRKFRWIRENGVVGAMACWNFGCSRTLNTAAVHTLSAGGELPDEDAFLRGLSADYFGASIDHAAVAKAWGAFYEAFSHHPMNLDFLYFGPLNYAPAFPWPAAKGTTAMARSWTRQAWGDRLEDSLSPYTLEEMTELLGAMATRWEAAMGGYRRALGQAARGPGPAREELGAAEYVGACLRSAHNVYAWYRGLTSGRLEMERMDDELALCRDLLPWLETDERLGFHQEARYRQCSPDGVRAKMDRLQELRASLSG